MADIFKARATSSRRGSAMIAVLFVVMTVAVLSVAYLQLSLSKNREGRSSVDSKRAFYVAEAGLAESFTALRMGRSGNVGTADEPARFAHGVFWVEATEQEDQTVLVQSTGLCGSGRTSLAVVVDRVAESIPGLGVFADQDVVVGPGALVDGYDSRAGAYGAQEFDPDRDPRWSAESLGDMQDAGGGMQEDDGSGTGGGTGFGGGAMGATTVGGGTPTITQVIPSEEVVDWYRSRDLGAVVDGALDAGIDPAHLPSAGRVSTNSDVTIEASSSGQQTMVLADVVPGPHGSVVADEDAIVSGATSPSQELVFLPPLEVPFLTPRGDRTHSGGRPFVVPTGEGSYGTLRVTAGSTLVLRGPLELVVDELIVDPGATLIIENDDGAVELFVTGYLGLEQGSLLGAGSLRPDLTSIVVSAGPADRDGDGEEDAPVTLGATGELHAMLYAPDAELLVPDTLEIFGSIAGQRVELAAGAQVHFDLAVADVVSESLAFMRVRSWRFVPTPDEPIVASGLDPLIYLQVAGVTPARSSVAYQDELLDIAYTCADLHPHRFTGPAHLFQSAHVATAGATTTTPAPPTGRLAATVDDYENPTYGHATPGRRSPFVAVGTGGL